VPIIMGSAARDFTPGAAPPTGLASLIEQAYGPLASRARPLYAANDPIYGSAEVQWATDTSFRCPALMQLAQHVDGSGCQFGTSVIGGAASLTTVLTRKRPSGATSY